MRSTTVTDRVHRDGRGRVARTGSGADVGAAADPTAAAAAVAAPAAPNRRSCDAGCAGLRSRRRWHRRCQGHDAGARDTEARTERGRIVFEDVPAGTYRLRFDRDGFISLEREVVARGGAPIDVKVTLTPRRRPRRRQKPKPPAPEPVAAGCRRGTRDHRPSVVHREELHRTIGRENVGPRMCRDRRRHAHPAARAARRTHTCHGDEFLYVIAGEGTVREGKDQQPLHAGVLILVPRGVAHAVTVTGRNPSGDDLNQVRRSLHGRRLTRGPDLDVPPERLRRGRGRPPSFPAEYPRGHGRQDHECGRQRQDVARCAAHDSPFRTPLSSDTA